MDKEGYGGPACCIAGLDICQDWQLGYHIMFPSLFPHFESMNDNTTIIVSLETEMQLY